MRNRGLQLIFVFLISLMAALNNDLSAQNGSFLEGVKYFNEGKDSLAKASFIKSIEEDSTSTVNGANNDAAYYYLARLSMINKDYSNAKRFINSAIERDSTNKVYQQLLAQLYLNENNISEPIKIYERLISREPKKVDYYYSLADFYIASKDYTSAKRVLDRLENMSGRSDIIASARLKIFRIENDVDGAIDYLTQYDNDQQSINVQTILGDLYLDRHNDSLAMFYYNKALSHDKGYAPALYGKAEVYRIRKDYPNFFKNIDAFISDERMTPLMKAEYIRNIIQTPKLITNYKNEFDNLIGKLDSTHPTDTIAKQLAVAYFLETKNIDKAREIIKRYALETPENEKIEEYLHFLLYVEDYATLESLLHGRGDALLIRRLQNHPNIQLLDLLGFVQFKEKKYSESLATFKKINTIAQSNKDNEMLLKSYTLLGDLSFETGDVKSAFKYYDKVLKINPNDIAVLNNYAYYLALQNKKLDKAYQMSRKTVEAEPDNPTYLDTFGWILFLMDKPLEAKSTFKHAMLYGGNESMDILDHYAEVLYRLKEYDLAFIYWNQAKEKDVENRLNLGEKIKIRKEQIDRK